MHIAIKPGKTLAVLKALKCQYQRDSMVRQIGKRGFMTMLRSVTVKFLPDMFEQIKTIAEKRGESLSDTIRYLLRRGLNERVYEENTDLVASVVRTEVEHVIKTYAIYPSLDNIEHPYNSSFAERLVLCRPNKNENLPS